MFVYRVKLNLKMIVISEWYNYVIAVSVVIIINVFLVRSFTELSDFCID